MTKAKTGALDALRKLRMQRQELDARETELRKKAAGELGAMLLECGAESLDPGELKALLRAAITLGTGTALQRLAG